MQLDADRDVLGSGPAPQAHLPQRVNRLLTLPHRLIAARRLRPTAAAAPVPVVPVLVVPVLVTPVLVTFVPGPRALGRRSASGRDTPPPGPG